VRSDAKASSAGSTEGSGNGRGLFRRAFDTRGASSEAKGSGARSLRLSAAVLLAGLLSVLLSAGQASAFDRYVDAGDIPGTAFSRPTKIAVDDATGNLLVVDAGLHQVQVWGPGGNSPSPSTQILSFGGQLSAPYGIAIDQSNGDAYVSNSGRNEVQSIVVTGADSGTYTLSFNGQTTAPIAFDADGATIQAALVALSNVAVDDVQVDGPGGPEAASTVAFTGVLAHADVAQITADGSSLNDAPSATASVTTDTTQPGSIDQIIRFRPDDRTNPTTYTKDPTFTSPAQGSDGTIGQIGNFAAALSVDPASGDLLVADDGNKYVERFNSSGAFISAFDGADTQGGIFQNLFDVVVGGGVIYVLDATGPYNDSPGPEMTGISRVERFNTAGMALGGLPDPFRLRKTRDLAYGGASGSVFIAEQIGYTPPGRLNVYRDGQPYQSVDFTAGIPYDSSAIVGIAADNGTPTASGRVYGLRGPGAFGCCSGLTGVQVFNRLQLPDLTLDPPSSIGKQSVHLSGTVDPLGITVNAPARFHFEYCAVGDPCSLYGALNPDPVDPTQPDPGNDPSNPWKFVGDQSADGGDNAGAAHPEADIAGLSPFSFYRVRLVGTNDDGTHASEPQTLMTVASAPAVVTEDASNRGANEAILHGTVNPLGTQSAYHFEYGTTGAYGSRAPVGHEVVAGNGQAPVGASQPVNGLQPMTTYHYRLVAENDTGREAGEDKTFTTLAAAEVPERFYELVSPAEKEGNNVKEQYGFQAGEDGDSFSFLGNTTLGGAPNSAPLLPRYVARRSALGWLSQATDPPLNANPNLIVAKTTFGVSQDGSKAIVGSSKNLAPGAIEGKGNLYLLDIATGDYTTMATTDRAWLDLESGAIPDGALFVQGTPDFDHVLLLGRDTSFLPGAPKGALYEFSGGQLTVVSRSLDDAPIAGSGAVDHGQNVLSADGSRVIFSAGPGGALYLRSGGVTRAVSESHRSSDPPGTRKGATLIGADRDLKHVYFFSQDLTDVATPNTLNLYRYDTDTQGLELLTQVSDSAGALESSAVGYYQVSADGSAVYFYSRVALIPSATAENKNVYVWRNGALSLVASLADGRLRSWWPSPSGRYFAFDSNSHLTSYDPANAACSGSDEFGACYEAYRFDTESGELICTSCRPDGRKPTGSVFISNTSSDGGVHAFTRAVDDRGRTFFDSPDQLVPSDTNSYPDVYEYSDTTGIRLISNGHGTGSHIAGVSSDGNDVFFTTKDRLVGIDADRATDVYDARVDGGLPSQTPPPSREECIRDDCKETPTKGPELPFGGSEGLNGPENVKEHIKKRCPKGRHARKIKGKPRCVEVHKSSNNNNRRQGR
jgi:hypothetical protein